MKNISFKNSQVSALIFGILVILFLTCFYLFAWQEPSSAPPGGNVPAPINVGISTQWKEGALGLGASTPPFVLGTGEFSATIIRDTDNSSYYLNPSGISRIGDLTIEEGITLGGIKKTTWPSGGGGAISPFKDNDGDGIIGFKYVIISGIEIIRPEDCDDGDPKVKDAPDGTCDGDLDKYIDINAGGNDCNDNDATIGAALICYCDSDKDGYFSLVSTSVCQPSCSAAGCSASSGNDCDDTNSSITVAADGTCDGDGDKFIDITAGGPDCDDNDSSVGPTLTCYCDSDTDTYYSNQPRNICAASCAAIGCSTSIGNDCDDSTSTVTNAADGTCDGDGDGIIDYTAFTTPSGNWRGWDLDDNNFDSSAGKSGTILYVTLQGHRGCFCPNDCWTLCNRRAAMDSFCQSAKPSKLQCSNIHAFINTAEIPGRLDIKDMPNQFGYGDARPIYWYSDTSLTKAANNWTDMCDGTLISGIGKESMEGVYIPSYVWTGDTGYCQSAGTNFVPAFPRYEQNVCYWWNAVYPEEMGIIGYVPTPTGGISGGLWLKSPDPNMSCYRDLDQCPPGSGKPCPLPALYCACTP